MTQEEKKNIHDYLEKISMYNPNLVEALDDTFLYLNRRIKELEERNRKNDEAEGAYKEAIKQCHHLYKENVLKEGCDVVEQERLKSIKHRINVREAELFTKLCKENPEAICDAVKVAIQRGNPALLNAVRSVR